MTRLSWDFTGPDPAPGDPAAYARLSRDLADTAEAAVAAYRQLQGLATGVDETIWAGSTADAFAEELAELPPQLEKLQRSYALAAAAMATYGRVLEDLQYQAGAALVRLEQAVAEETEGRRARDQALADAAADPLALVPPGTSALDRVVDDAGDRLRRARTELERIAEDRRAAESRAVAGLQAASDAGIANDAWHERALAAVGSWVDDHADILEELSGALQVVSGIAGVLSFIPVLAPVFAPIALASGAAALGIDAALVATGNGDWKSIALDAGLMALPGLGKLARSGLASASTRVASRARPPGGFTPATRLARAKPLATRRLCGDPIDVASGEMVMSETDVELAGTLALILSRTHLSSYREGRWFGPSWASTLDQRLEVDAEGVCYLGADGVVLDYPHPGEHPVLPLEGPRWPLARAEDGSYSVTDPERGQTMHFAAVGDGPEAGDVEAPDAKAATLQTLALRSISNRHAERIDLDYDGEGILTALRGGYHVEVQTSHGLISALRLRDPDYDGGIPLVSYHYDEQSHLREVVNSSGRPLRLDYDGDGRITSWQDRNGVAYAYTYASDGRCLATQGPNGVMDATLVYDDEADTTVVTNSLGHTTTYHHNARLQVTRVVDPFGHATTSTWDTCDQLLERRDALGRTTRYAYDDAGNLLTLTRPDRRRIQSEYNELGLATTLTGPDGARWHQDYDERGNLTEVTDPTGATTSYAHDEQGHLASVTDALGHTRHVECNAAGLPIAVTDALGALTRYRRDGFGRIETIEDPLGGVTRLGWTIEGKLATRTQPDGATEAWSYDGEGNLIEHTDALGHVTTTTYTAFDLPETEIGPNGARLEFSYDPELRLVAVTNPQGLVWRYDYDPAGNLVGEIDFNGRELTYAHDAAGQLIGRTNGMGETTLLTRSLLGDVVEQRWGEAITTFEYDPAGRMTRATNADADVVFEYDPLGQVLAETCNGRTLTSSYDALGRRTHRRTPSGAESIWDYDANGQPVALHTSGHTLRFDYDAAGREVERTFGAVSLTQTWDANHRLASQTVTTGGSGDTRASAPRKDRLIQRRAYSYRSDGYVTSIDDHLSGLRRYDLDAIGRVTAVTGSGWSERYAYDPAGNIANATWPTAADDSSALDAQGKRTYAGTLIRRAGRVRYEHDAQGRVVLRQQKRVSGKPRTWHYEWEGDDRLVGVTTPEGQRWRYRYDALGRRVAKQRLGDDGKSVVEEVRFSWDGTVLGEQTRTSDEADSGRITTWEWEPGSFRPISQIDRRPLAHASQEWIGEQFQAMQTDLVGTPTELVDADGNITWHQRSTLWGVPASTDPAAADCPLRFPGQYHDFETASSYNCLRYYDTASSRYQASDPIGLAGGTRPHGYVLNPTGWSDPLGLMGKETCERVGRWMSQEEFGLMSRSRRVIEGGGGRTYVVRPPNPDAYPAGKGVYVEFDVPTSSLHPASRPEWAVIPGPNAGTPRYGPLPSEMPPATRIDQVRRR